MLAAYLESEGWTVWWDTKLAAGDAYRDDIAGELAAARAVIVLWTQTSIKSDFVRAEAGRAKADGKLIPVKEPDVAYSDIPLPFGEMHTEAIANRELIRAAVVSQLAKPALQPSALRVATKTLRYQVLTWIGIVGGSLTLFTNVGSFLNLADWARWLVTHWHEWTAAFWQWGFALIHISIPRHWTGMLSFLAFGAMIAISQRIIAARARKTTSTPVISDVPALRPLSARTAVAGSMIGLSLGVLLSIQGTWELSYLVCLILLPTSFIVASNYRLKVTYIVVLTSVFFYVIVASAAWGSSGGDPLFGFLILIAYIVGTSAMLAIAPVNALLKRLTFLAFGVILLVALNQLSLYAPDIREWLKPPVSS